MSYESPPRSDWYVMLFPRERGPEILRPLLQEVLPVAGGEAFPDPHVTIAYLAGQADPRAVVARLETVAGPAVTIRAGRLFAFSDDPHPANGYLLAADVPHDDVLRAWHDAVVSAVAPLGLAPVFGWTGTRTHLHVARCLDLCPSEVLERIAQPVSSVTFEAARLVVSYRDGERFVEVLDRVLTAS